MCKLSQHDRSLHTITVQGISVIAFPALQDNLGLLPLAGVRVIYTDFTKTDGLKVLTAKVVIGQVDLRPH